MKKHLLSILFLLVVQLAVGQSVFKYVIIPTAYPEIGEGFNPYGISGEIQRNFHAKSIQSQFESKQKPADLCDALTVSLIKKSSMFKNKLRIELKDCMNNVVWAGEGEGESKEYRQGYAEAVADALSELKALPENNLRQQFNALPAAVTEKTAEAVTVAPAEAVQVAAPAVVVAPESLAPVKAEPAATVAPSVDQTNYKPRNLYWNSSYFIDVVQAGNEKQLIVLDGKLLGYTDFQEIGTLSPSGLEHVFTVKWVTPDGKAIQGVAKADDKGLTISLNREDAPEVIYLQKY